MKPETSVAADMTAGSRSVDAIVRVFLLELTLETRSDEYESKNLGAAAFAGGEV